MNQAGEQRVAARFGAPRWRLAKASSLTVPRIATATPPGDTAPVRHALDRGGYYATTELCIESDGTNRAEDINLATKNALLNMIDHLVHERGFSRIQAYVIASVGVDVTVDGIAAVPNTVVSAILPDDIFI